MEDQRSDNTVFRIKETITEKRDGFMDYNGSALGDNLARSLGEYVYYPLMWNRRPIFF